MKETLKLLWIKIKAWLLALAANLWEDYLKDALKAQLDDLIHRGINYVNAYYKSEDYEKKKEEIVNFIFKNIQLPLILKPFKGLVKAILITSIEKQIEKGIEALNSLNK